MHSALVNSVMNQAAAAEAADHAAKNGVGYTGHGREGLSPGRFACPGL